MVSRSEAIERMAKMACFQETPCVPCVEDAELYLDALLDYLGDCVVRLENLARSGDEPVGRGEEMSKFQPRTLSEIMAMDTERLAWELAQYGRIEVLSDAPTDPSWRQPDGLPWTVVVWTYDSGENLSDEGALDESEPV